MFADLHLLFLQYFIACRGLSGDALKMTQTHKILSGMNKSEKLGVVKFKLDEQTCQVLAKRLFYIKKENG